MSSVRVVSCDQLRLLEYAREAGFLPQSKKASRQYVQATSIDVYYFTIPLDLAHKTSHRHQVHKIARVGKQPWWRSHKVAAYSISRRS